MSRIREEKTQNIISVDDLLKKLLHSLKQSSSGNEMCPPFLLAHPVRCERDQYRLSLEEIVDSYPTYFQIEQLFLLGVNLAFRLLNSSNGWEFVLIDVVPHWRLHSFHITVVFWNCPFLLMSVFLEQFHNQPLWFVLLFNEWQHLIHNVRNDVSILIFPFYIKV